jgi:hypothetical protein
MPRGFQRLALTVGRILPAADPPHGWFEGHTREEFFLEFWMHGLPVELDTSNN